MQHKASRPERAIARIASGAHGIVTREELLGAGLTLGEIRQRLEIGALLREHRSVYRVGHRAPSTAATYMAAVRACGDGGLLSRLAGAYLLVLIKGPAPPPEVTTAAQRRVKGVLTHRSRIDPRDATEHRGIPVTTPARTLVDIAATLSPAALARACHEAGVRYRTTPGDIEAVLERRPNSPGAGRFREIIGGEVRVTLSALERRFLARLRAAGLELPQTNRVAGTHRVDCRWPQRRLTVELDSFTYHNSRHSWEQDHRREREARARGDDFRRYTYSDVFESPAAMLRELEELLR